MIHLFYKLRVKLKGSFNPHFVCINAAIFFIGYFYHNLRGIFRHLSAAYALPISGGGSGGGGAGGKLPPQKDVRGQTCLFATPSEGCGRVKKTHNDFMTKYLTRHINIRIYNS